MSMTERAVTARMMHKLTDQEAEDLITIDLHVVRDITDFRGTVMDSRTAVLFRIEDETLDPEPSYAVVALANADEALVKLSTAYDKVTPIMASTLVAKL